MAMLDVVELAEQLLRDAFCDTRSAIAVYETQMGARTAAAAEETLRFMDIFHSPDVIARLRAFFESNHEPVT